MSSSLAIALLVIGGIIIVSLMAYAAYLLLELKKRSQAAKLNQAQEAKELEAIQQKAQERLDYIELSLSVLGVSLRDKQITTGEASIRICGLLDFIALTPEQTQAFTPFFDVREALAHIPQLSDFKALSKEERLAYHKEIEAVEQANHIRIEKATQDLIENYPVKDDKASPLFYTPVNS